MVCINSGEGTRIDLSHNKLSCIDVTLMTPQLASKSTWRVLSDTWGSDHCPIIIELDHPIFINQCNLTPKWSLKKADWNKFENACNQNITEPNISDNIDNIYNNFILQLDSTMSCSIPKTNPNHCKTPTSWWNDDCKHAIAEKKNALKKLKKTKLPSDFINYKKACATARKTINAAKRKDWENFCSEINPKTNTKIVWNKIKRKEKKRSINSIPVLHYNNSDIITDEDKTEALADNFAKVSSDDNHCPFTSTKKEAEDSFVFNDNNDCHQ